MNSRVNHGATINPFSEKMLDSHFRPWHYLREMRNLALIVIVFAIISGSGIAQDVSVRVIGKEKSSELILVGRTWHKDLPERLKVRLRATKETPTAGMIFSAYFYDDKGSLIRAQKGPNMVWAKTKRGVEEVGVPETLESARASEVFLALTEDLKALRTTIVVFGDPGKPVADIYPSGKKIEDFEFPEKEAVLGAN